MTFDPKEPYCTVKNTTICRDKDNPGGAITISVTLIPEYPDIRHGTVFSAMRAAAVYLLSDENMKKLRDDLPEGA